MQLCLSLLSNFDSFARRIRALVRAGTSEVVRTHAILPEGDPVLASRARPIERAGRFAVIYGRAASKHPRRDACYRSKGALFFSPEAPHLSSIHMPN